MSISANTSAPITSRLHVVPTNSTANQLRLAPTLLRRRVGGAVAPPLPPCEGGAGEVAGVVVDDQVEGAVVVVIGGCDAHAAAEIEDASLLGDLGEGAAAVGRHNRG